MKSIQHNSRQNQTQQNLVAKARLAHLYVQLNPAELRRRMDQKIAQLWKISR